MQRRKRTNSYVEDEHGNIVAVPKKRKAMTTSFTSTHRILTRLLDSVIEDLNLKLTYKLEVPVEGSRFDMDIYIPEIKLCLEASGFYWHTKDDEVIQRDIRKKDKLASMGILMETFFDTDLENLRKSRERLIGILHKRMGR